MDDNLFHLDDITLPVLEPLDGAAGLGEEWGPAGQYPDLMDDPCGQAAAVWTDQIVGCCCAVPATAPAWTDQLYPQLVAEPTRPIVWTGGAPDPGWATFSDAAAAPTTYVTYPDDVTFPNDLTFPNDTAYPNDAAYPDDVTYPDGGAADPGTAFTTVVGDPDSAQGFSSSLVDLYDQAVQGGDPATIALVQKLIDTQTAITQVWVS